MNARHLGAFVGLRWHLFRNQMRRGGVVNAVLVMVTVVVILALSVILFATAVFAGALALPYAAANGVLPIVLLFTWDVLVVVFLFWWAIGLLVELQRSEVLSLDRFLHLPVSLGGVFLINYVSSLFSVTLAVLLPAMLGLCLVQVFVGGPALLLALPLLASFVLMVTALTYQFQGWLATLMANPRRRRTVIVFVTMGVILFFQFPQLFHLITPWIQRKEHEIQARRDQEMVAAQVAAARGEITAEELQKRLEKIKSDAHEREQEMGRQVWEQTKRTARIVNTVVPPGWLPLGTMAAAEGNVLPALLGTLGMTLIGSASLWRAYGTTRRLYTGQYTAGKARPAAAPKPVVVGKPAPNLLEKQLPWVGEQVAAVTLAGYRSLTRAPEAKILLLPPIILTVVFGSIFVANRVDAPEPVRPLMAFGAMSMVLLMLVAVVGNQFGFDRDGFRVFVLCPASRRDVLLGKNLACAPLALALGAILTSLIEVVQPMRVDHFLAALVQLVSMYLLYCLLANLLSILAPMRMAPGTMKPANHRLVPVLLQMAFIFVFPPVLMPLLLPLGIEVGLEYLLGQQGWGGFLPIYLIASVLFCVGVVFLYRLLLTYEGRLLHAREQHILTVVTTRE